MTEGLVNITDLSHSFQEGARTRQILNGAELEVHRGESVALLGRSGSGKSTLLNLISGIEKSTSGHILVNGYEVSNLKEPALTLFRRQHIGFIYQFFHLVPTLKVTENIALGLELNRWSRPAIEARVKELLKQVALSDHANRFPDQLSGGEQQRVAIARALAHKPLLLLADEPTGNLDAEVGQDIMALLQGLVVNQDMTLILVTHSQAVAKSANRILTLEQGRLAEREGEFAW